MLTVPVVWLTSLLEVLFALKFSTLSVRYCKFIIFWGARPGQGFGPIQSSVFAHINRYWRLQTIANHSHVSNLTIVHNQSRTVINQDWRLANDSWVHWWATNCPARTKHDWAKCSRESVPTQSSFVGSRMHPLVLTDLLGFWYQRTTRLIFMCADIWAFLRANSQLNQNGSSNLGWSMRSSHRNQQLCTLCNSHWFMCQCNVYFVWKVAFAYTYAYIYTYIVIYMHTQSHIQTPGMQVYRCTYHVYKWWFYSVNQDHQSSYPDFTSSNISTTSSTVIHHLHNRCHNTHPSPQPCTAGPMPKPLGPTAHVLRGVRPPSGLRPVRVAAAAAPLRPWGSHKTNIWEGVY